MKDHENGLKRSARKDRGMKLSGNTILVTGGSAGIGLAFAKKFVELGNEVTITGSSQPKLDAVTKADPRIKAVQCDASDPDAISRLGQHMRQHHPKLNVLMNNAGIFVLRNLAVPGHDLTSLTKEVDVNVAGPIRTVAALIDQMKDNRGTIINVSSALAFVPTQASPIYCATKAAIHSYTISLRYQMAEHGVEVIELMPPAVKTDMTTELPEDGGFKIITTKQLLDAALAGFKSGKVEIRPGQANQLHWMSRIAPGFINGQIAKGSKQLIPN